MKRALVALAAGAVLGLMIGAGRAPKSPFDGPLPPPPDIRAARGPMPANVVSFEERVMGGLAGCGFFLRLPSGETVGITTAHSMGNNFSPVEFRHPVDGSTVGRLSNLYVPFGAPSGPGDLTGDYAILRPDAEPPAAIVLEPDPRGEPQPGERVSLLSGLGIRGPERVFEGTVQRVTTGGAWVQMDTRPDPGLLSGSPVMSQHTGKVVGVTTAALVAAGPLRLGIAPIRTHLRAAARK